MKKTFLLLTLVALLAACNSGTKDSQATKEVTLEELLSSSETYKDKLVSLEGMVTHVCKHGGQKLFLTDEGGERSLLVRVSSSIPEFDVALEGSDIQLTGKLIATVTEVSEEGENHEGDGTGTAHTEGEGESTKAVADCPTEEALAEKNEGESCSSGTNVSYHLEATSFKEITKE